MSSLNIALFCLPISMFQCTSVFSYHFESLLFLLSFIYGESDHVSYMTDKSSCSICKLKNALGHHYVVLTIQGFIPSSDYYPDSIIILSEYYLFLPSRIQFLVTLVICWRIHYLPHHSIVSHHHFLKTNT